MVDAGIGSMAGAVSLAVVAAYNPLLPGYAMGRSRKRVAQGVEIRHDTDVRSHDAVGSAAGWLFVHGAKA